MNFTAEPVHAQAGDPSLEEIVTIFINELLTFSGIERDVGTAFVGNREGLLSVLLGQDSLDEFMSEVLASVTDESSIRVREDVAYSFGRAGFDHGADLVYVYHGDQSVEELFAV